MAQGEGGSAMANLLLDESCGRSLQKLISIGPSCADLAATSAAAKVTYQPLLPRRHEQGRLLTITNT
jgi:hypothetical protein